jgi:hypothetical protein
MLSKSVNADCRSAEDLGVHIRYDALVDALALDNGRFTKWSIERRQPNNLKLGDDRRSVV